jgi:hypothetical protein
MKALRNKSIITISSKGRSISVPYIQIEGRTVIASGKWLKIAEVNDEVWLHGEVVQNPGAYLEKIRQERFSADIFTFTQKLPNVIVKYHYPVEWSSVAAIRTTDYLHWWENRVSQVVRKNVRRSERRGLVVRSVEFTDELVRAIMQINNESPVRQGRLFWHYGKSFDQVKNDYATLLDRSEYLGAYVGDELVGFIKMVCMGETAGILQLLCRNKHYDKRPANALVARAVQVCCEKRIDYLTYGQYIYGNKTDSPLTEFKRRNGFEEFLLPRYYIPVTLKGRIAVRTGLHRTWKRLLPKQVMDFALKLRSMWYEKNLNPILQ